tara:strand:+ start:6992 stop:7387 length:396 start_codon:yes stop_codon:yes gene_type:complete
MAGISVEFEAKGVSEVLRDFAKFPREGEAAAEKILGQMWLDFDKFNTGGVVLAPGAGSWPVDTGRSVKSWTPRIRGANFTAINFTDYSPYVRKSGEPVGTAVQRARATFMVLSEQAATDITNALHAILKGS